MGSLVQVKEKENKEQQNHTFTFLHVCCRVGHSGVWRERQGKLLTQPSQVE